jgi:hypothetical protein
MNIKKIVLLTLLSIGLSTLSRVQGDADEQVEINTTKLAGINEQIEAESDITGEQFTEGLTACIEGNTAAQESTSLEKIAAFKEVVTHFNDHIENSNDEDTDHAEAKEAIRGIATVALDARMAELNNTDEVAEAAEVDE